MRTLYGKVKSLVTSNTTALLFAVATSAAAFFRNDLSVWIVWLFAALLGAYFLLWVGFLVVDWLRLRRRSAYPIEYEAVTCDWRVERNGDFFAINEYVVKNVATYPITNLPADDALWFHSRPDRTDMEVSVESTTNQLQHKIIGGSSTLYDTVLSKLSAVPVKGMTWSIVLQPALLPGDRFSYKIKITSRGTEQKAFQRDGTFAGIAANLPVRGVNLTYTAPQGCRFELLDPVFIVDSSGARMLKDEVEVPHPELKAFGSTLFWEFSPPRVGRRYWFRYRLNDF